MSLPSLDAGQASRSGASATKLFKSVTLPQLTTRSSDSDDFLGAGPKRDVPMGPRRKLLSKSMSSFSLKASLSSKDWKRCKKIRSAIRTQSTFSVSRAVELMDGGIVTDLLMRDYITANSQTQDLKRVGPDDLYQWYKDKCRKRVKMRNIWRQAFFEDEGEFGEEYSSSSDGETTEGEIVQMSDDPAHIASMDRLGRALEHQIFLFWRKANPPKSPSLASPSSRRRNEAKHDSTGTTAGLLQGLFGSLGSSLDTRRLLEGKLRRNAEKTSINKLQVKIFDICQQLRETACLQADVKEALKEKQGKQELPPFMLRDDQNIQRSTHCGFWNLYHTDESKLQHMMMQNARGKKKEAASVAAKQRSKMQAPAASQRRHSASVDSNQRRLSASCPGPRPSSKQLQDSSAHPLQKEMAPKLQHSSGDSRPVWTPPGHSRPQSRVSSRGSKVHTPSATTRQNRRTSKLEPVQAAAADHTIGGIQEDTIEIGGVQYTGSGTKILPFTILESPPPIRSEGESSGPFGSLRSSKRSFHLSSLDRHARLSRKDWLHRIGQEHRADQVTLPMVSHTMRGTAAYEDLQMAVGSSRKSSSTPSLMPAAPTIPEFAKTFSTPEKLPPVLGLAGHSRRSLPLGKTEKPDMSPTIKYLDVCKTSKIVPRAAVLRMSQTCQIMADNGDMFNDTDLKALAAMVKSLTCLKVVDFSGNVLLSDRALVPFLNELNGAPAEVSLTHLSLKGCRGSGRGTVHTMVSLITNGLVKLLQLNLSGVSIPGTSWLPMCNAMSNHPSLRSVHLADTGLGLAPNAPLCVTNLLASPRIEVLDLGWNSLSSEVFKAFGESVCEHRSLRIIYLANCTGARTETGEMPISQFLEFLSRDRNLEMIDVACNGIEYKCALILEAALENHAALSELRLGQNPLGLEGMRCFLRLLSRDSCGLLRFDVDGCECPVMEGVGDPKFNPTNPAGRYSLDLSLAYDRTILRMLYSTCEKLRLALPTAFKALLYTLEEDGTESLPFEFPSQRESAGTWCVPTIGYLDFVFAIEDVYIDIDDTIKERRGASRGNQSVDPYTGGRPETADRSGCEPQLESHRYLHQKNMLMRIRPSFQKVKPLLTHFCSLRGQARDQKLLLDALARDFSLTFAHLKIICDAGPSPAQVTTTLLHCLNGGDGQRYLTLTQLLKDVDKFLIVHKKCHALLHLNVENPTGHYELNLANPGDYFVAETLMLLDAWEGSTAMRSGLEDLSLHGNWSSCRNCLYQNASVLSLVEFRLTNVDKLVLDYVTWRRPPPQAKPLADDVWSCITLMLYTSWGRPVDKVTTLRRTSNRIYVSAMQLRELLGLFTGHLRIEAIVIFALRLTDPQNMKVMRACLAEHEEWTEARRRVGSLHLFPHFQPEDYYFELDLNIHEDRKALAFCVQLANRERHENLRHLCMILPDGSKGDFQFGISKKWEIVEEVPMGGQISFQYVCAPEDRQFEVRREFAMTCGSWQAKVTSPKQVMWWKDLSEAPDFILIFLENCMRVFKDAKYIFAMCNTSNSGRISRKEWEEFIASLGWKEFKDDPSLTKQLFRYMDPDGGGDISKAEFHSLQELWNELSLSIVEFFKFLDRTFSGNLDKAWEELDMNGDGAISLKEWVEVVELIGYHGHSMPIFYLVAENTGRDLAMTNQGWCNLKVFWEKRHDLLQKILGQDDQGDAEADFE